MNFFRIKYRASLTGAITVLIALSVPMIWTASAYDAPNFEYHAFSADGLFLEGNDRDSLLQALASIASNFPDNHNVDSDLREKALALALRIEPLHKASRMAHRSLSNGKNPATTGFFKKTVTISDTLWSVSEKLLSGKPEPEAAKLAPYLMDLSLSLSPTPPPERLDTFARLTKFKLLPWDKFVSLQPKINSSSGKIGILFSLLKMETASDAAERSKKVARPKTPPQPEPESKPVESVLKLQSAFMPGFFEEGKTVGVLRLNMREISGEQKQRLNKRRKNGVNVPAPIHLGAVSSSRVRIIGFPQISRLTRSRYEDWPVDWIALFSFVAEEDFAAPLSRSSVNISLPGMILMHSVFTGKAIDQSMIFAGEFEPAPDKEQPDNIVINGGPELLENIQAFETPFLVLPESAYSAILEEAIAADKLGSLFNPQLLSYSDLDDAIKLAMDEPAELRTKAKAAFEEIEAVISQMPLEDLARNKAVRLRLQKIVDDYPRHLSARMMLDFGKGTN